MRAEAPWWGEASQGACRRMMEAAGLSGLIPRLIPNFWGRVGAKGGGPVHEEGGVEGSARGGIGIWTGRHILEAGLGNGSSHYGAQPRSYDA